MTLDKLIRTYGLKSFDPQLLWDRISLGDYHIKLVPDGPSFSDSQKPAKELVIALNTVRYPKSLAVLTYKRLLCDDFRQNHRERDAQKARSKKEPDKIPAASVDWLAAEDLVDRALANMAPRDAKLVELIIVGHTVQDLSAMSGLQPPTIYSIYSRFRHEFLRLSGATPPRRRGAVKKGAKATERK